MSIDESVKFASRAADAWLTTNVLEVPSHMTPVIKTMTRLLMKASATHEKLNIISGPTCHHSPSHVYLTRILSHSTWHL